MNILSNKNYKEYNRLSRYSSSANYYNEIDKKYQEELPKPMDKNSKYSLYIADGNESFDFISLKFYNNPTYYWIICDFNNISNPYLIPSRGTKLRIPVISDIQFQN